METNGDNLVAKSGKVYYCDICDYKCFKKYNWVKHLNTSKHSKMNINGDIGDSIVAKSGKQDQNVFSCNICNKKYMSRNGLWKHKMKCNSKSNIITKNNNENNITPELVLELIKNNEELMKNNIDLTNTINNLVKNGLTNNNITNNNTINNNNSHNKTFNLQVFLNETCKDAMNINDFVDSIKLQLSDFERMGEVGYAQGISDIITSKLQALDITQRPVHCTDKKRETMYVKDQDQWTKEDENKTKIKKMIKRIENKNIQIIPQFQKKYPNYANPKSHESDKYHKTIIEVMGGAGGSEGKEGKIIRNISKVTTIREKE